MFQLLSQLWQAEQLSAAVLRLPDWSLLQVLTGHHHRLPTHSCLNNFEGLIATPDMFVRLCAQGSAKPEESADSTTAAAKAAREPGAPDAIGPIDRMVADLLYKEPLQQVRLGDARDLSSPKRQQWVPRFLREAGGSGTTPNALQGVCLLCAQSAVVESCGGLNRQAASFDISFVHSCRRRQTCRSNWPSQRRRRAQRATDCSSRSPWRA